MNAVNFWDAILVASLFGFIGGWFFGMFLGILTYVTLGL